MEIYKIKWKYIKIIKYIKIKELVSEVRKWYFTVFIIFAAFCYVVWNLSAGLSSL